MLNSTRSTSVVRAKASAVMSSCRCSRSVCNFWLKASVVSEIAFALSATSLAIDCVNDEIASDLIAASFAIAVALALASFASATALAVASAVISLTLAADSLAIASALAAASLEIAEALVKASAAMALALNSILAISVLRDWVN